MDGRWARIDFWFDDRMRIGGTSEAEVIGMRDLTDRQIAALVAGRLTAPTGTTVDPPAPVMAFVPSPPPPSKRFLGLPPFLGRWTEQIVLGVTAGLIVAVILAVWASRH